MHHKPVTTCLKDGGPVSKFCPCVHCTLSVCRVCGAYEGSLTTDCPGEVVDLDRQKEVYETNLDYTKSRGWHQKSAPTAAVRVALKRAGIPDRDIESLTHRTPRFESTDTLHNDNTDHARGLQHELAQKAIAWVRADRICDDRAAALTRIEDEVNAHLRTRRAHTPYELELIAKLKGEEVGFRLADQRARKCDEEFREAAKKLVDAIDQFRSLTKGIDL